MDGARNPERHRNNSDYDWLRASAVSVMPKNSVGWFWALDHEGKPYKQHIPFNCDRCGEPSCYGKDGVWYCGDCWLTLVWGLPTQFTGA